MQRVVDPGHVEQIALHLSGEPAVLVFGEPIRRCGQQADRGGVVGGRRVGAGAVVALARVAGEAAVAVRVPIVRACDDDVQLVGCLRVESVICAARQRSGPVAVVRPVVRVVEASVRVPGDVVGIAQAGRVHADIGAGLHNARAVRVDRAVGDVAVEARRMHVCDEDRARGRDLFALEQPGCRIHDTGVGRAALPDVETAVWPEGEPIGLMSGVAHRQAGDDVRTRGVAGAADLRHLSGVGAGCSLTLITEAGDRVRHVDRRR